MKNQPHKATVKDGLPTAESLYETAFYDKSYDQQNGHINMKQRVVGIMQSFSDHQNAELRERVKELEGTLSAYKECFEQFVPESKWDEATAFLSSYGNGLAKDFQLKENQ